LAAHSADATFCVMVLHFLSDPRRAVAELSRITRAGGSVIVVDLVRHNQEWMREQMAHRWLGFERNSIEEWFRDAGVNEIAYELTGSYAGEKLARNGNRPVEIFVARAIRPTSEKARATRKANR
jgi:SAM-dependent methyltransferase